MLTIHILRYCSSFQHEDFQINFENHNNTYKEYDHQGLLTTSLFQKMALFVAHLNGDITCETTVR